MAEVARRWWVSVLCALLGMGVASIVLLLAAPYYTAGMVVGPAAEDLEGGGGGVQSAIPSLVQSFGLGSNVAPSDVSRFSRFLETLTSVNLSTRLMNDSEILAVLFPNEWDSSTKTWHPPRGPLFRVKGFLLELFGMPRWVAPGPVELSESLADKVAQSDIELTGMKRITLSSEKPDVSVAILRRIYQLADQIIREDSQKRTQSNISYLRQKLTEVNEASHRLAFIELLIRQERRMMLSVVEQGFAAEVIEPAYVSPRPSGPNVFNYLFIGLLIGVLTGLFSVLLAASIRWAANVDEQPRDE